MKVTEFRPIAPRNAIYKVISKLLGSREQLVMPSLINLSQSAFVKGHLIAENMLLDHNLVKHYERIFLLV